MTPFLALALAGISLTLSGCLARTAANVVTAPVRVGAKAVDLATTSQSEADEKRGREIRRREERLGRLEREYEQQREDCYDGDRRACDEARKTAEEIDELLPQVPYEPR
ncbi:hypothetical protein [Erythrobacter sp. SCSIO 43205]|uniref:hypothetical protein n=1 Tax=Erythrobacter sp. SCSIO 43205 TaxID=2779361 RepID=UPI00351D1BBC